MGHLSRGYGICYENSLLSHNHQELASGLSGGIDATTHALRVNRCTVFIRIEAAPPIAAALK